MSGRKNKFRVKLDLSLSESWPFGTKMVDPLCLCVVMRKILFDLNV